MVRTGRCLTSSSLDGVLFVPVLNFGHVNGGLASTYAPVGFCIESLHGSLSGSYRGINELQSEIKLVLTWWGIRWCRFSCPRSQRA